MEIFIMYTQNEVHMNQQIFDIDIINGSPPRWSLPQEFNSVKTMNYKWDDNKKIS